MGYWCGPTNLSWVNKKNRSAINGYGYQMYRFEILKKSLSKPVGTFDQLIVSINTTGCKKK